MEPSSEQPPVGIVSRWQRVVRLLREDGNRDAWLMPDDPRLYDLLEGWRSDPDAAGLSEEDFYVRAAAVYYGLDDSELCPERWHDLRRYVDQARRRARRSGPTRSRSPLFRPKCLLQLVFAYGLGIESRRVKRSKRALPGEDSQWAETWPVARWALHSKILQQADWLAKQLAELGLPNVRWEMNLAKHFQGVLCGTTACDCMDHFRQAHPGCATHQATDRHCKRHLLASWLDQSGWPDGDRYRRTVYPISRFVFRAIVGDHPEHAKDFEKGLCFRHLECDGVKLDVIKVLLCNEDNVGRRGKKTKKAKTCNSTLSSFEQCSGDDGLHMRPKNKLGRRVVREGDHRYRAAVGKRCRKCGSFSAPEAAACPCGHSEFSRRVTSFFFDSGAPAPLTYLGKRGHQRRSGRSTSIGESVDEESGDLDVGTRGPDDDNEE